MRSSRGGVVTANISASTTSIAGPNERRVALLFTGPPGNPMTDYVTLSTESNISGRFGLILTAGMTLEITLERHGDAVKKPWYAISPTVVQIGYLEVTTDD